MYKEGDTKVKDSQIKKHQRFLLTIHMIQKRGRGVAQSLNVHENDFKASFSGVRDLCLAD